jgi:hypothetical protein
VVDVVGAPSTADAVGLIASAEPDADSFPLGIGPPARLRFLDGGAPRLIGVLIAEQTNGGLDRVRGRGYRGRVGRVYGTGAKCGLCSPMDELTICGRLRELAASVASLQLFRICLFDSANSTPFYAAKVGGTPSVENVHCLGRETVPLNKTRIEAGCGRPKPLQSDLLSAVQLYSSGAALYVVARRTASASRSFMPTQSSSHPVGTASPSLIHSLLLCP